MTNTLEDLRGKSLQTHLSVEPETAVLRSDLIFPGAKKCISKIPTALLYKSVI